MGRLAEPAAGPGPRARTTRSAPGARRLQALDEQIRLANAHGIRVVLMPYRFPTWANGTAALSARKRLRRGDRLPPRGADAGASGARYERGGPDARVYSPRRRALGTGSCSTIPTSATGAWPFFDVRYGRASADAFELVNEPNLQLWPQRGIARARSRGCSRPRRGSRRARALDAAARAVRSATTTRRRAACYTRCDEFVPALLDELAAIGYLPHSRPGVVASQLHRRRAAPDGDGHAGASAALLAGRWAGYAEGAAPTVFVTEGGARLSRMPALYPDEEPRRAQAKCLRDAWALHRREDGAGAGVAMFAQYLLYADPNFDCGLLDPYPSTVKRPAYAAWKAFPAYS